MILLISYEERPTVPEANTLLPLLIEPEALHTLLSQPASHAILLVDLRSEQNFLLGHIPNAQLVQPNETQASTAPVGLAPSDTQLTQLMQRIGLTEDTHVVVYDDEGGGWAGRFIWLLDEIGHTQYSYLNGGILAWSAAGLPLSTKPSQHTPSNICVTNHGQHSIHLDALSKAITNNTVQIWDARSPMEYSGEKVNAAKGGHIPGAFNYEWTNAMDSTQHLKLKPLENIRQELSSVGISADKDTVTHCQSHHRSGLSYLLGKLLNFKSITAYPGSWSEWGNHPQTPTQTP